MKANEIYLFSIKYLCEPDLITEGGADQADLFLLESGAGDEVQGGPAQPAVIFTILFLHLIIGV